MQRTPGVIIDIDGTLVDSNGARAQAWVEALNTNGHPVSYGEVRRLIGLVPAEVLVRTVGFGIDSPAGSAIARRASEIFGRRLLHRVGTFHRARELYQRMYHSGLRLSVASHDPHAHLLPLLKTIDADVLLPSARSDSIIRSQTGSNREVVKAALDRLGASPPMVLMIADAPFDIEAAAQLNIPAIGLASGGWSAAELKGAIAVYEDAAHLVSEIEHSPVASLLQQQHAQVA